MKCPICNLEMFITNSKIVFENDDTPEKETKAFVESELSCRNKQCSNNGKVVQTIRGEIS